MAISAGNTWTATAAARSGAQPAEVRTVPPCTDPKGKSIQLASRALGCLDTC